MLVEFYKGPASGYNAGSHSNGIYQCTDTGDTYIFGVLNKGGKGIRVLDFATDFKGGSGNMDGDLYNTLKQELSDGVPMFIKMMVGENPIIYPLIVSKSRALASPNPEVLDFQIAINSIMGDNEDRDGGGISVMANFLEVRGDTFEISLSAQNLLLLTEEKDYFRVLANNGQYIDTLLYIGSIPKQAYNVVKEVIVDKNLTSETWKIFKTYVDTGIRSNAYWDYYFTGTSFGTFRYDYTENTATITTYSLVDESLENPAEQLSKQYATIYNISSEGSITSTTTNVPKLQYDESGVIVGAGNGTEEKSITLLTGGDGSKVLADNGSYISSQDSRVYVWEISEIQSDDIPYDSATSSGSFSITKDEFDLINNSKIIVVNLTNLGSTEIFTKSDSGGSIYLSGYETNRSGMNNGDYSSLLSLIIENSEGETYNVNWEYSHSRIGRYSIIITSFITIQSNGEIQANSQGITEETFKILRDAWNNVVPIELLSQSYYGGLSKVVSILKDNVSDSGNFYIGILLYSFQQSFSDNYPKLIQVKVSSTKSGDYYPVTILSVVDLKTLSIIKTDGEGNQFLSDNGTYKTISIPDSVTSIKVGENADSLIPESGVVTLPAATTKADGILGKTDKAKLDSLDPNEIVYVDYDDVQYDGQDYISKELYDKIKSAKVVIWKDYTVTYKYVAYENQDNELIHLEYRQNATYGGYNSSSILSVQNYTIEIKRGNVEDENKYFTEKIKFITEYIGENNLTNESSADNTIYSIISYSKDKNGELKDVIPAFLVASDDSYSYQTSSIRPATIQFRYSTSNIVSIIISYIDIESGNLVKYQVNDIQTDANISDYDGKVFTKTETPIVSSIKVGENSDTIAPVDKVITLPAATTEADGIMSKTDKTSLDSLSGLGFVLLSEEETNELLNNDSSTAISEPLYTKLNDPNTHLVIFTNVSKEGGLDGGSSETERIYYMLEKRVIATGNTISLIYSNSYGTSGTTGNISYRTYDIDTDKIVTRSNFHLTFELMGDGDKFLSDDGTYKVIEVPTEATQISLSNSYVPSDLENESLIPAVGDTVETVIGKLHKAILDNEEVVASAFTKLNSSCGFNNNGEYVPVGSITTGTNSLGGAISKLDSSISSIKSFRDITVGDSTLTPESSSDTLTLTQGEGITLTPGGDNKSLTISASGLVSRVTAVESELQGVNALADELLTLTE